MSTTGVKAWLIRMYLKKGKQSGTETKDRRKRSELM